MFKSCIEVSLTQESCPVVIFADGQENAVKLPTESGQTSVLVRFDKELRILAVDNFQIVDAQFTLLGTESAHENSSPILRALKFLRVRS